jgi:hypothetical protein
MPKCALRLLFSQRQIAREDRRKIDMMRSFVEFFVLIQENIMDAQSQSEHPLGKEISRRTLAQVFAAGAVATTAGTPAFAQQTSSMSEASPQDYVRDPTRWGSPEVAALFPGFKHLDMRTKGAVIRVRHGGSGPPLLLLHGYPNNHVLWHAVAGKLAQRYHVVCPDLRGYGDSSLPDPGARLINYSHRAMAED